MITKSQSLGFRVGVSGVLDLGGLICYHPSDFTVGDLFSCGTRVYLVVLVSC